MCVFLEITFPWGMKGEIERTITWVDFLAWIPLLTDIGFPFRGSIWCVESYCSVRCCVWLKRGLDHLYSQRVRRFYGVSRTCSNFDIGAGFPKNPKHTWGSPPIMVMVMAMVTNVMVIMTNVTVIMTNVTVIMTNE